MNSDGTSAVFGIARSPTYLESRGLGRQVLQRNVAISAHGDIPFSFSEPGLLPAVSFAAGELSFC